MPYDIIPVCKHLVQALQPVATSQGIKLTFKSSCHTLHVDVEAGNYLVPVTVLFTRMLKYLDRNDETLLTLIPNTGSFRIRIDYTGRDLSRVLEIHKDLAVPVSVNSIPGKYSYEMDFPTAYTKEETVECEKTILPKPPLYYAEIRKRLTTHFKRSENLVNALARFNTRDAVFLKKINALVMENIDNPQLDANFISQAMNMSRTQLFRRLKPIIRQSPGNYVKSLRLQKAKELMETTDLRVGEVAFRTGFETPANFTRAFTRQFGFNPSLLCKRKGVNGTNG